MAKGERKKAKGDSFLSPQGHFHEVLFFAFFGYSQKSTDLFSGVNTFKNAALARECSAMAPRGGVLVRRFRRLSI
jgi:hypothetical protein